ncbi:DUF3105 domain-containing protein [Nocardioides cheoyonin]|uniref:DUF3105 domain-containing protein n=1 Tax=Nocardioides cheoyonin TaxID=3156615 RepID=UPI0032B31861
MAKKSAKSDRRAVIDDIRKKQKGAERARGLAIIAVCVVIAVGIVVAAAFKPIKDSIQTSSYDSKTLQEIGESPSAAGCQKVVKRKADGNQQHIPTGTQQIYTTAPAAFGPHWNEANVAPVAMSRKFYSRDDRPELEALVHNLEHGYTLLWYDDTVSGSELNEIRAIGRKFPGDDDFRYKFIAVPWTKADETETTKNRKPAIDWPKGTHIAFTHWTAKVDSSGNASDQYGVFQYCSGLSGQALKTFMEKYPYTDSPEPGAM